ELAAALSLLPDWPEPAAAVTAPDLPAPPPVGFAPADAAARQPIAPSLPLDHPLVAAPPGVLPPLQVVTRSPMGEPTEASQVVIGFSRPMVALSLAEPPIVATISPQPPGAWRWLDPQTLVFEARRRFPMASEFEVAVLPCADLEGVPLADPPRWRFATPALTMRVHEPGRKPDRAWYDHQRIALGLDQLIDQAALLPYLRLTVNGEPAPLELIDLERPENTQLRRGLYRWNAQVTLAFRLVDPLPARAEARLTLLAGAPSAEGPRRTAEDQSFEFHGYDPLELRNHYQQSSTPLTWVLSFSNRLLAAELPPDSIRIEPAVEANIEWTRWDVTIKPEAAPGTEYAVALSPTLRDIFGQALGPIEPVLFKAPETPFRTLGQLARPSDARLYVPNRSFVSLDPNEPPRYTVFSRGLERLEARIYAVGPEDWGRFNAYQEPLGTCVWSGALAPDPAAALAATPLDLSPALRDGRGQFIVEVWAPPELLAAAGWHPGFSSDRSIQLSAAHADPETTGLTFEQIAWTLMRLRVWVQVTAIDLSVFLDQRQLAAWASSLLTGEPLAGVELSLRAASALAPGGWAAEAIEPGAGVSDDQGTALLAWEPGCNLLLARLGGDLAMLPVWDRQRPGLGAGHADEERPALWYVLDDRQLYRPGETLAVKGWVRRLGPGGGWSLRAPAGETVSYALIGPHGRRVAGGKLPLGAQGGFELRLELPESIALGKAWLRFSLGEERHEHALRLAEFRRPEFAVTASADPGPHVRGALVSADMLAQRPTGEPLAGARIGWRVVANPVGWSPPHLSQWAWQTGRPSLFDQPRAVTERAESAANHEGRDGIVLDTAALPNDATIALSIEATASDASRQSWSARADALVHPAELYVGLWVDRRVLAADQLVSIAALVVDLCGRPVPGREIRLRLDDDGEQLRAAARTTLVSAAGPVYWRLPLKLKTDYRISAAITDDAGRHNASELTFRLWREHAAADFGPPPGLRRQSGLELVPGGPYQPGETALIRLSAPIAAARGVVRV
ncbi:MAG TPA: MG2 domain-containing protein, partial [Herpetosiphonaceae bacterium]